MDCNLSLGNIPNVIAVSSFVEKLADVFMLVSMVFLYGVSPCCCAKFLLYGCFLLVILVYAVCLCVGIICL